MILKKRLLLILSIFISNVAAVQTVRYTDATSTHLNPNNKYFILLLEEALKATQAEFGDYALEPVNLVISQNRQLIELNKGTFDVFWTMSTPAREVDALAVDEPLMKGAYGIRLLVTHRDFQPRLQQISTLAELGTVAALSGTDWPDTAILRMNHLQVTTELFDKDLYTKLLQRRQYYFPRGLLEAKSELNSRARPELVIVPTMIIRYPAVMKFFVAKDNTALAQRLTAGLQLLKQNGRAEQLFYQFAPHAEALNQLELKNATVIELRSPFILSESDKEIVLSEQNALLEKLGITLPSFQ